jgi:hypothetical protein
MKRTIIVIAASLITAGIAAAAGAQARPRVEVVFALDSTGSMSGLIEGAKQKIWSIANGIADAKIKPELRIGLLSYRDIGDDYVTKRYDLTDDIDAVFERLRSFNADGGGDDEESVNQALSESVALYSWSSAPGTLKIVFLVGDYPPHMDYSQDIKYPATCKEAVKRGIIINTIQCGDLAETAAAWKRIAELAHGDYVALLQSGNMAEIETPFDDDIAKASADLGKTLISYGSAEEQSRSEDKIKRAAEAPASVAADRAAYNLSSGGKAIQGRGDLLEDANAGLVDPAKLKDADLPPEMKGMDAKQRSAYIKSLEAKRASLNVRLTDLNAKRGAYLETERKRLATLNKADSFDDKISEIVNAQMKLVK